LRKQKVMATAEEGGQEVAREAVWEDVGEGRMWVSRRRWEICVVLATNRGSQVQFVLICSEAWALSLFSLVTFSRPLVLSLLLKVEYRHTCTPCFALLIHEFRMARNSRSSKSRRSKPRPPKMGRKWTQDDLLAYNIKIDYQDLTTFFGVTELPPPNVVNDVLTAHDVAASNDESANHMLVYMKYMTTVDIDTGTLNFVRPLFELLKYAEGEQQRSLFLWTNLRYMSSPGRPPQVDACVIDHSQYEAMILVVKVDRHLRGFDAEARLISDAIAAFHNDNNMRAKRFGTNPLASKVMPGIVMDGTMPTFYKIPITAELVRAVESGERPEQETVVHAYVPEVPTKVPRPEEGMKPLDNRYIILSCYDAFKKFM